MTAINSSTTDQIAVSSDLTQVAGPDGDAVHLHETSLLQALGRYRSYGHGMRQN